MAQKLSSDNFKVLEIMERRYLNRLESEHWQVIGYLSIRAVNHFTKESRKIEENLIDLFKRLSKFYCAQYEESEEVPAFSQEDRALLFEIFSSYHEELNAIRSKMILSSTIKIVTQELPKIINEVDKDIKAASDAFLEIVGILFKE